MKAVILEVKNGYAAALKDDGTVVKIKDENYNIGDVIRMNEKKPFFNKKWGTLVAALLIFAMVGTGTLAYAEPFYFVGFEGDDNQITFEVNRFNRVIGMTIHDEDIKDELENINLDGMRIERALTTIIETLKVDLEDDSFMITTATTKEERREDAEKLAARIRERVLETDDIDDEDIEDIEDEPKVEAVGFDMVQEAKSYSIAPGKLNIINKLFEENDDMIEIGSEKYKDKKDFIDYIQETIEDEEDIKPIMKDLMKAYSGSKGKESAPGQLKKQEEVQTENRNIEQNTEENQEMNGNKPENNPGNKGGNGKGN